eukprot:m.51100 g.51100  ORF g.51100 m.51100 type:complete len:87 (-) comp12957_c0_seq2:473-733(-)
MVYISNSTIQPRRSRLSLAYWKELFWAIINFFYFFFMALFMPGHGDKPSATESDYRRGGGGGSGRRGPVIHGMQRTGGGSAPPMGG